MPAKVRPEDGCTPSLQSAPPAQTPVEEVHIAYETRYRDFVYDGLTNSHDSRSTQPKQPAGFFFTSSAEAASLTCPTATTHSLRLHLLSHRRTRIVSHLTPHITHHGTLRSRRTIKDAFATDSVFLQGLRRPLQEPCRLCHQGELDRAGRSAQLSGSKLTRLHSRPLSTRTGPK